MRVYIFQRYKILRKTRITTRNINLFFYLRREETASKEVEIISGGKSGNVRTNRKAPSRPPARHAEMYSIFRDDYIRSTTFTLNKYAKSSILERIE